MEERWCLDRVGGGYEDLRGTIRKKQIQLLAMSAEKQKLEDQYTSLRDRYNTLKAGMSVVKSEADTVQKKVSEWRWSTEDESQKLKVRLQGLGEELHESDQQVRNCQKECDMLREELLMIKRENRSLQQQHQEHSLSKSQADLLSSRVHDLHDLELVLANEVSGWRAKYEAEKRAHEQSRDNFINEADGLKQQLHRARQEMSAHEYNSADGRLYQRINQDLRNELSSKDLELFRLRQALNHTTELSCSPPSLLRYCHRPSLCSPPSLDLSPPQRWAWETASQRSLSQPIVTRSERPARERSVSPQGASHVLNMPLTRLSSMPFSNSLSTNPPTRKSSPPPRLACGVGVMKPSHPHSPQWLAAQEALVDGNREKALGGSRHVPNL